MQEYGIFTQFLFMLRLRITDFKMDSRKDYNIGWIPLVESISVAT